jgi:hypothetical protein
MDTGAFTLVLRLSARAAARPGGLPAGPGARGTTGSRPREGRVLLGLDIALTPREVEQALASEAVLLGFDALTAAVLAEIAPDVIALPLMSRHSDALQMLQTLADLGFRGQVRVYAPPLPDRHMVQGELVAVSQALTVSLLERSQG